MSERNTFYSDYYEKEISISTLEDAYDSYIDYCNKTDSENEAEEIINLHGISGLHTGMVDHILYHAEINGFVIE